MWLGLIDLCWQFIFFWDNLWYTQVQMPLTDWTYSETWAHISIAFNFEMIKDEHPIMRSNMKTLSVAFTHFPAMGASFKTVEQGTKIMRIVSYIPIIFLLPCFTYENLHICKYAYLIVCNCTFMIWFHHYKEKVLSSFGILKISPVVIL